MSGKDEYIFSSLSGSELQRWEESFRERIPLIHCMTNSVVENFTANSLLAVGASPAMIPEGEEAELFQKAADALLINIGTFKITQGEAMLRAIASANREQKPWVLDPVAVSPLLTLRSEWAREAIKLRPTLIRGNPSEILYLAGESGHGRGTDSLLESNQAVDAAKKLAIESGAIVAVTGAVDYIVSPSGTKIYTVPFGSEWLTKITGAGCALSAFVAAALSLSTDLEERVELATFACSKSAAAGAFAERKARSRGEGLGSFMVYYLDYLSQTFSYQELIHDV